MCESLDPSDNRIPSSNDSSGKVVFRKLERDGNSVGIGSRVVSSSERDLENCFDGLQINGNSSSSSSSIREKINDNNDKINASSYVKPTNPFDTTNERIKMSAAVASAKRPNTLCTGFSPLSVPPVRRRPASSYISSGISCMTPVSTTLSSYKNEKFYQRPTSLYSSATPKIVTTNHQGNFRSVQNTPTTPQKYNAPRKLSLYSSGFQTWNHNPESNNRPASFCGSVSSGNFYTWSSSSSSKNFGPKRPRSFGPDSLGSISTTNNGPKSLPSSISDYMLLSSKKKTDPFHPPTPSPLSAQRRLSLPSAQAQLRPKFNSAIHGLPFRPFTCGVSPNGTPIFLGCTHLHPSPSPVKPRAVTPTTSQAIQQLLLQSRNGYQSPDDKMSLFFEILDSQERFVKVKKKRANVSTVLFSRQLKF